MREGTTRKAKLDPPLASPTLAATISAGHQQVWTNRVEMIVED
jgi:hypothetical protein